MGQPFSRLEGATASSGSKTPLPSMPPQSTSLSTPVTADGDGPTSTTAKGGNHEGAIGTSTVIDPSRNSDSQTNHRSSRPHQHANTKPSYNRFFTFHCFSGDEDKYRPSLSSDQPREKPVAFSPPSTTPIVVASIPPSSSTTPQPLIEPAKPIDLPAESVEEPDPPPQAPPQELPPPPSTQIDPKRTALPQLPAELWIDILILASDSLKQLEEFTRISSQVRAVGWSQSALVRARVAIRTNIGCLGIKDVERARYEAHKLMMAADEMEEDEEEDEEEEDEEENNGAEVGSVLHPTEENNTNNTTGETETETGTVPRTGTGDQHDSRGATRSHISTLDTSMIRDENPGLITPNSNNNSSERPPPPTTSNAGGTTSASSSNRVISLDDDSDEEDSSDDDESGDGEGTRDVNDKRKNQKEHWQSEYKRLAEFARRKDAVEVVKVLLRIGALRPVHAVDPESDKDGVSGEGTDEEHSSDFVTVDDDDSDSDSDSDASGEGDEVDIVNGGDDGGSDNSDEEDEDDEDENGDLVGPLEDELDWIWTRASYDGRNFEVLRILLKAGFLSYHSIHTAAEYDDGENITPLHVAARYGSLTAAKFLVEKGAKLDINDAEGMIPLHVAKYLAQVGGPTLINQRFDDGHGNTALLTAATNGDLDLVQSLLELGAEMNMRDLDGNTLLHYASGSGSLELMKFLLEDRVEEVIDIVAVAEDESVGEKGKEKEGEIAEENSKDEPVTLEKTEGSRVTVVESHLSTPPISPVLSPSSSSSGVKTLKAVHKQTVHLGPRWTLGLEVHNNSQVTPIGHAVWSSAPSVVAYLLDAGCEANMKELMESACMAGSIPLVKVLMERGAAVEPELAKDKEKDVVVGGGNEVKPVVVSNATITADGPEIPARRTSLKELPAPVIVSGVASSSSSSMATLSGLSTQDIQVNDQQPVVATPLSVKTGGLAGEIPSGPSTSPLSPPSTSAGVVIASVSIPMTASTPIPTTTRARPARRSVITKDDWTPLNISIFEQHIRLIKFLIDDVGCSVNARTVMGQTPFYSAAGEKGDIRIAKLLLSRGADFDIRHDEFSERPERPGFSALHRAVQRGHLSAVLFLVKLWGPDSEKVLEEAVEQSRAFENEDDDDEVDDEDDNDDDDDEEIEELTDDDVEDEIVTSDDDSGDQSEVEGQSENERDTTGDGVPVVGGPSASSLATVNGAAGEWDDQPWPVKDSRSTVNGAAGDSDEQPVKGSTSTSAAPTGSESTAKLRSCVDCEGSNPMHIAAQLGDGLRRRYREIVEALVSVRPDWMNAVDKQGRTPLDVAVAGEFDENARVLVEVGCRRADGSDQTSREVV
ncbi:hypothetical protein HDU76_000720 [Blyttiomyces sp. JEL0837]|nr:hypothetical protein HDU76_000720 [Blyttiomyces sp. JEL0837]